MARFQARMDHLRTVREAALQFIHRNCGQLCGQPCRGWQQSVESQAPEQNAYSLSTEKALKNNHLDHCETYVTVSIAAVALLGAVVDFSGPASTGFADD